MKRDTGKSIQDKTLTYMLCIIAAAIFTLERNKLYSMPCSFVAPFLFVALAETEMVTDGSINKNVNGKLQINKLNLNNFDQSYIC